MNAIRHRDYTTHETLLQWLIGMSVLAWLVILGIESNVFVIILDADRSHLSLVIMLCFLAINLHVFLRVVALSNERNAAARVRQLLSGNVKPALIAGDQSVQCCEQELPSSLIAKHILNLTRRSAASHGEPESADIQAHLLKALGQRVHGSQKYGWILADLMIKLGLIGTVIGFVLMLASVATLQNYDISTMQDLLKNMSDGMRVALYTTLSGLSAGVILALQYQFLDRHADELIADITEITEVYVLPLLNRPASESQAG